MSNTPLTPPPAGPAPEVTPTGYAHSAPGTPPPGPQTAGGKTPWIPIVIGVVAGCTLLFGAAAAALAGIGMLAAGGSDGVQSVDATGIDELDINASAARFELTYGRVDEATLEVTGARGPWTFERQGDTLRVDPPNNWFGWWFWTDQRVVLTLPEDLRDAGLDAEFDLSAGEFDASGAFGTLELSMSAGSMHIDGAADELHAKGSAGTAELTLADVREAELKVSAGEMVVELTGRAPSDVSVDVSAGSITLTVPDETYNVRSDVSAGGLTNRLDTASASPRSIQVDVSAGSVTLLRGD